MKDFAVVWHWSDYRGDHSADMETIVEVDENTTLRELIDRTMLASKKEWLSIRPVVESHKDI